jgi:hypothetical protein
MKAYQIDDKTMLFTDMRKLIDFQFSEGMTRRTTMYQEIQGWCNSSPNPHGWPNDKTHHYYFGYFSSADQQHPEILPSDCENLLVSEVINLRAIGADKTADLVIVPQSQIGPVAHEFVNRYTTDEGEIDLNLRDGDGGKHGTYEYGECTANTKHQERSREAMEENAKRADQRETMQFWM